VSKQSKQNEKDTKKNKTRNKRRKIKNDLEEREQVVFDAELSKVKISFSIKL
jgi:hypothetical protein